MAGYAEDLVASMKAQTEFLKKQVMLEVIQVAATCDTYEEFKRAMYGKAIEYMKELEAEGGLKPGTVEKILQNSIEKGEINGD
jgi:hypothetical protein